MFINCLREVLIAHIFAVCNALWTELGTSCISGVVGKLKIINVCKGGKIRMSDGIQLAVAYYSNGVIFKNSAEKIIEDINLNINGSPKSMMAIPFYFLTSHAAELFLKAALLKRGVEERDLRKYNYRHNLKALLSELQSKGLSISENTVSLISGLSEQHKKHALRYTVLFDDGQKTYWPPISHVIEMLDELLLLTRISTQGM